MKLLKNDDEFDTSISKSFKMLQALGVFKNDIDADKYFTYGKSFIADATKFDDYGVWFLPHSTLTDEKWNDAWKYELNTVNGICNEIIETFDSSKKRSDVELERAKKQNELNPTRLIFAKSEKTDKYIFLGVFVVNKSTRSYSYTKWSWKLVNSNYNY